MNRTADTRTYESILALVSEYPEGIGISALCQALSARAVNLNRRTLQRRLAQLVREGRLATEGRNVACVYKFVAPATPVVAPAALATPFAPVRYLEGPRSVYEVYVPLSDEGAEIRAMIRKPLTHRRPVGYERKFLESYEPGLSRYLPDSLRLQLHEIGRLPQGMHAEARAQALANRLLVDLSWTSSRLEGCAYTRAEAKTLIESGKAAEGRRILETQMILNHKAAVELLIENAAEISLDLFTFRNLHAVLSQNLRRDDSASGHLRRRPVEISGTVFHPPAIPQFIENRFCLLLEKANAISDPFEQAFFLLVQLPYLQPFEDMNKGVSRIAANIPLLKHGLCPLTFVGVSELAYTEGTLGVYELGRIELLRDVFLWAYERACQQMLSIEHLPAAPDPLQLRYRQELIEAVQTLVRGKMSSTASNIRRLAEKAVPAQDRKAFEHLLGEAIQYLDEGRLARYRLKRSEYDEWIASRGDRPR